MGTAKRLLNEAGLRGSPAVGTGPKNVKKGLKGDMGAGRRFSDATGTEETGVTAVATGDAGLGGGANTFPSRGASDAQYGDARGIMDSDTNPLGIGTRTPLATFTVATGTGGAGTFDATPADEAGEVEVVVFKRGTDTDEDGPMLARAIIDADGLAHSISIATSPDYTPGDVVVVYARPIDTDGVTVGEVFTTRRTVTTDNA